MIPTVQQILDQARSWIGDDEISGGQVYTNTRLLPRYKTAYSELYRAMQKVYSPRVRKTTYYNLPANTSVLAPSTAGISNCGEIEEIWERGSVTSVNVGGVSLGSGFVTLTTGTHTFVTGDQLVVAGVGGLTDDVNDLWTVTISSATTVRLNGCTATGTYTSGGTVSKSSEQFILVNRVEAIEDLAAAPGGVVGRWYWQGDVIKLSACSATRQLKIVHLLSGNAPTTLTDSTGIDDSLDFLSMRTAALALWTQQATTRAQELNMQAVGPAWDSAGIAGGMLGQLLDAAVRDLQALPQSGLRAPPARPYRRSTIF